MRTPKHREKLEIVTADRNSRVVWVYVSNAQAFSGPRQIIELLNQEHGFFPAHSLEDETLRFIHRAKVVFARPVPAEPNEESNLIDPEAEMHSLVVLLDNGVELHGQAAFTLPAERTRTQDFLNSKLQFFRLAEADGRIAFINKAFVREIIVTST